MAATHLLTTPQSVSRQLLPWFALHGRSFSWRDTDNPFNVLIAEILLRKTGARAVEQFLSQFLAAYPDVVALANAPVEELTANLAILGLSVQRARQLRALGCRIFDDFNGAIPSTAKDLASLPAVGRYTAGIVASACFDLPEAAVDTNVARVICRVFGLTPSHAEPRKSTNVWAIASELVSASTARFARTTWAMLDLAAAHCTSRSPHCLDCPLRSLCRYADGVRSQQHVSKPVSSSVAKN